MNYLQIAAQYYKENILKYVFIFETIDHYFIVVYPEKRHFLHLTGVHHSKQPNLSLLKDEFYNDSLKGKICLEQFISSKGQKELADGKELSDTVDKWIYNRVTRFSEIFNDLLFDKIEKLIKNKQDGDDFISNYFSYDVNDSEGRYLGIKEELQGKAAKNNYYKFSTIIIETERPNKYLAGQRKIHISNIIKLEKNNYNMRKKEFDNCIKFKPTETAIKKLIEKNYFVWDKNAIRDINNKLINGLKINKGEFKKNSISVKRNGKLIQENIYDVCKEKDKEAIIEYINNNYSNKN